MDELRDWWVSERTHAPLFTAARRARALGKGPAQPLTSIREDKVGFSPKQDRIQPDPANTQPLLLATQATNGAPFTIR